MIIGKLEETIEVTAQKYVEITIEEDGNRNSATILLFPNQAEELIKQLQSAVIEVRENRKE